MPETPDNHVKLTITYDAKTQAWSVVGSIGEEIVSYSYTESRHSRFSRLDTTEAMIQKFLDAGRRQLALALVEKDRRDFPRALAPWQGEERKL